MQFCDKRKISVECNSYCDWFDKKKVNLIKHRCSNCRWFIKNDKSEISKTEENQADKKNE